MSLQQCFRNKQASTSFLRLPRLGGWDSCSQSTVSPRRDDVEPNDDGSAFGASTIAPDLVALAYSESSLMYLRIPIWMDGWERTYLKRLLSLCRLGAPAPKRHEETWWICWRTYQSIKKCGGRDIIGCGRVVTAFSVSLTIVTCFGSTWRGLRGHVSIVCRAAADVCKEIDKHGLCHIEFLAENSDLILTDLK